MRSLVYAASVALVLLGGHAGSAASWDLVERFGDARVGIEPTLADVGSVEARALFGWDFLRFAGLADRRRGPSIDRARSDLVVPGGTWVAYYVDVPAGAALRFAGVAFEGGPRAKFEVGVETDTAPGRVVARLDRSPPTRSVALSVPSGVARVWLAARGDPSATLRLKRPAVDVASPAATPPLAVRPPRRRPNIVVYLVDTLRADQLGCYGHDGPTSPRLDAFAHEAIRFTDAVAEAPWTRASIASLFTGLPAHRHGVNGRIDALPEEADTMAERFARAGYQTAAFTTNGNVASVYGFAQGFQVYELLPGALIPGPDGIVLDPLPSSDGVTRRALEWLDGRDKARPFLLFLHAADPHGPYIPPPEFRARVGAPADPGDVGSLAMLRALHEGKRAVDAALVAELLALYDGEVAENDEEFGRVLDGLRSRGLYDDTVVVFVSDHGEEFHEHGGWEHGDTLYRELTRIPLVMKLVHGDGAGRRVDRTVQLGDVLPTLLRYAGVAQSGLPGADVLGRADAAPAMSHLSLDGNLSDSLVAGRWHLVRKGERIQLFDRDADPSEQRDVFAEHRVTAGYVESALDQRMAAAVPVLPSRTAVVTDEVRQNLKALGYVR
jgi:arylsulfatase A-like enzyme